MNQKIHVLMVDDEERFRTTTERILRRKGFEVLLAASGKEALEKLEQNPDVVVLDLKMPLMDGHEVLEEMKKVRPNLPVIMLTGHGTLPSAKEALDQGAFTYLSKPCDIDVLATAIQEAFHSLAHEDETEEKSISQVMIPLADYTTLQADATVAQAIRALRRSFDSKVATGRIMETGHRSILVKGLAGEIVGLVAITDLLSLFLPGYLTAPKPSTADSIQYAPLFWTGMFSQEIKKKANVRIQNIMSPPAHDHRRGGQPDGRGVQDDLPSVPPPGRDRIRAGGGHRPGAGSFF